MKKQNSKTAHTLLTILLAEYAKKHPEFEPIMSIVTLMHTASNDNISFNTDDIGINVTSNTIEITDIFENELIATITLNIK